MPSIIKISNFHKSFGKKEVIKGIDFEVEEGEIFAYLGLNGSGKTTTIRTLLNIYEAEKGELLIDGIPYTQKDSHKVGYLPEERGLYMDSNVLDLFLYFGELKGLSRKQAKQEALDYLEKVGLGDKIKEKIKKLSSGQQQKIQLGITIINKPKILILDEPMKGLDPINRNLFLEIFMELKEQGSTILFSSHQMEEVEKIADSVLILKDGKIGVYGKINDVKKSYGENMIRVEFKGKFPKNEKLFTAYIENNYAELTPIEGISSQEILKYLANSDIEVLKYQQTLPSLNDIFIRLSQEKND